MKTIVAACILGITVFGSSAVAETWSKPINGLSARLEVLPPEKGEAPFYRVYVEFKNVSNTMGQMRIRFAPNRLKLQIVDENSKELAAPQGILNGKTPLWEPTMLPYGSSMKIRISFNTSAFNPGIDKAVVDVGPYFFRSIPQDTLRYYISGSLTIKKEQGDHSYIDWNGTLELPKIEIPILWEEGREGTLIPNS